MPDNRSIPTRSALARLRPLRNVAALSAIACLAGASCGSGPGHHSAGGGPNQHSAGAPIGPGANLPAGGAPVIVSNVPLALLVSEVGGKRVKVEDLAASAPDDRAYSASPAQLADAHTARASFEVGAGYQPQLEPALKNANPATIEILPALGQGTPPQFWLDPPAMAKAAKVVAGALTHADPAGAGTYKQGADNVASQTNSLSITLSSALSSCPRTLVVAPDAAFASLTKTTSMHLVTVPSSADPATITGVEGQIHNTGTTAVFSEPPLPDPALDAVAAATHASVHPLDTFDGPAPPDSKVSTYVNRLEVDISRIAGGLYCTNAGNNS